MSQITRCPFCSTAFKVVADQLRISDGWVRCGQCKEVFDASAHLQMAQPEHLMPEMPLGELRAPPAPAARTPEAVHVWGSARPAPAPAPAASPGRMGAQPPGVPAPKRAQEPAAAPERPEPEWDVPLPAIPPFLVADEPEAAQVAIPPGSGGRGPQQPLPPEREALVEPVPVPSPSRPQEAEGHASPLRPLRKSAQPKESSADGDALNEQSAVPTQLVPEVEPRQQEPAPFEETLPEDEAQAQASPAEPGFVKAARRSAFWRKPVVRGVLALAGLALVIALAAQVAVQERDVIASRYPAARAWLEKLCEPLQCTLQAPRHIAAVVIDSSSFLKARNDASAYQLQMSIKNTSALTVAMPALEFTLTDAQDQAVLRRVLLRDDVAAPAELAPGSVWNGSVSLQVTHGAAQVAGYRLLAFYP